MKKLSKLATTALSCIMVLTAGVAIAGCNNTNNNTNSDDNGNDTETTTLTDTVTVEGGKIKGYAVEGNEEILSFKGIPYAAPPVGENRWKRPQPVISWEGVKDCKDFGYSAMQGAQEVVEGSRDTQEFLISQKNMSEDCLTLNVWSKGGVIESSRPVLVYIHGGAWVAGGSSCEIYDGVNTAKNDVVFVSVNYRLGIFGWFANDELIAEDPEHSAGNYGLMDIVKSLEWVRDNISAFGGDGNNITIMGQSAGANLSQMAMVSPKTQGLIKNTVTNSFNSISSQIATVADRAKSCNGFGTLEELRALSAEELLNKYSTNLGVIFATLGICNDGVYVDKTFKEALEGGRASNVNLMSGFVWDNEENNDDNDSSPFVGGFDKSVEGLSTGEVLMGSLTKIAKARKVGNAAGKTYIFDFAHPLSGPEKDRFGAFHTGDIPYFFNYFTPSRKEYWTDDDVAVGNSASSYLINFCKTGNPNGEGLTEWKNNDGSNYNYLLINQPCELKSLTESQITAYEAA